MIKSDKIDELQDKIDIKDDALIAQTLVIDCIKAENAALKRNQENSVKMFKELLIMLDKVGREMKGMPISDKEYAEAQQGTAFKPENLHKKVKRNVDAKRKICYNAASIRPHP